MYGNSVILWLNRCAAVRADVAAAYGINTSAVFAGGLFHCDRLSRGCRKMNFVFSHCDLHSTFIFLCVRSEEYHKECALYGIYLDSEKGSEISG